MESQLLGTSLQQHGKISVSHNRTMSLKILLLGILVAITQARVETKHHSKFLPMVAMSCGFRNMYTTEKDGWKSDTDRYATCFSGKFDILKYCQKVYPNRNITNIVEYAHDIDILNWCREEGSPCKWTHNVRPYHCIEGDFPSVALQVPEHCRFSHISTSDKCEEYHHWKEEATKQCSAKLGDFGKPMVLHSMAVMETCAIDMFRGVEFVCCNTGSPREDFFRKQQEDSEDEENSESDEEDDDEKDDEDSDSYAEDSDEDEDEIEDQDPYFKAANWTNEHDDFKLAEDRMEQRQRKKIDKVMKQWAQLESRYAQMKKKDPSGAEKFKVSMTERFQKTVASLEEEHKRMRKDIESVHEERVQALLNEKKRDSTHDYRQALSTHVVKANKHIVLQTLKTYIRTEEKDRMHTLNRYRHLLRTDRQEAELYKNKVLHKLRYIDLRINGTIAMLRDFPDLEKYVRPIAVSYWQDYRRENTPELTDSEIDTLNKLGEEKKNMKLIDYYTQQFEKSHSNDKLKLQAPSTTVTSVIHPADPLIVADKDAKVLPTESKSIDSEENDDDYYEDEQDEQVKKTPGNIKVIEIKPKELTSPKIIKTDTITDDDSESSESSEESTSEDDDDDSEDVESSEKNLKELRVDIEPIIEERAAFARHDRLVQSTSKPFFDGIGIIKSTVFLMAVIGSIYFVAAFAIKSRRANRGFIEVDVYTPEERHVAGMQVNGYENPTYSFFDSKA